MGSCVSRPKTVEASAAKVRAEGWSQLSSDIGKTLNQPESSDVIFVCRDGERVYGCRWLLSLRSPFFKGMFSNKMLERESMEVSLAHFTSSVLLWFFEFLYTGAVPSSPPLSWKMGFEMIRAAHFFMVPAVESIVQEFLWKEVSKSQDSKELVMMMLTDALEFKESWQGKESLLLELTDELRKDWFAEGYYWFEEDGYCQKLSEDALEFILSNRKCDEGEGKEAQSVKEYYIFRQIVQWLVHQILLPSNKEARKKLREMLPSEEDATLLWSTILKFPLDIDEVSCVSSKPLNSESHDPTAVVNSRLGIEICKESFQRLVHHVEWCRIPAMLLLKVIHPLEVVPANSLFKALAFHALHRPVQCLEYAQTVQWKGWGFRASDSHAQITFQSNDGLQSAKGEALAILPMSRSYGIHAWSLKIPENDACSIFIGMSSKPKAWKEISLSKWSTFYAHTTKVICISRGEEVYLCNQCPKPTSVKDWEKVLVRPAKFSPITFTLDASKKICRVTCGESFVTEWRDLPVGSVYPYIGVYNTKSVTVEFKFHKGFKCL